jgi:hypothetical protein
MALAFGVMEEKEGELVPKEGGYSPFKVESKKHK